MSRAGGAGRDRLGLSESGRRSRPCDLALRRGGDEARLGYSETTDDRGFGNPEAAVFLRDWTEPG